MRVLIIPSWYPSKDNPVSGIFFKEQAEALSEQINVAVLNLKQLSFRYPKSLIKRNKGISYYENNVFTMNKYYINWIPKILKLKMKIYKYHLLNTYNKIVDKFGEPDLIHAQVSYPAGYGAKILSDRFGIPFIVTEHASFFEDILMGKYKKYTSEVIEKANKYIAVSSYLKEKITEAGGVKCELIPNFINIKKFDKRSLDENWIYKDKFNLLHVSLMSDVKRIDLLLKSIKKIIFDYGRKNIHLHLIGKGPKKDVYESISEELSINEYCTFYGMVENDKVARFMNKCNTLVISSKSETFGVVGIEAMAAGLPVISTKCGGPEDYVTPETGILVEKENVNSLTEGILNMMNNFQQYDTNKIKNYVKKNYSKEVVSSKLINLYKDILKDEA